MVVDAGWLEQHGVSRQLWRKYAMNGWLRTLARGVYSRPERSPALATARGLPPRSYEPARIGRCQDRN